MVSCTWRACPSIAPELKTSMSPEISASVGGRRHATGSVFLRYCSRQVALMAPAAHGGSDVTSAAT